MKIKKISDKQFILDCINKGFEIANNPLHWDTFEDLLEYSKEHKDWYAEAIFTNIDQYIQWRQYYLDHFYDWKPKRIPLREAKRYFSWFSLQYGPKYTFDYSLLPKHEY